MSSYYIDKELKTLERELADVTDRLADLPPGSMVIHKNGSSFKRYQVLPGKNGIQERRYIRSRDHATAVSLARKAVLLAHSLSIQSRIRALKSYLDMVNLQDRELSGLLNSPLCLPLGQPEAAALDTGSLGCNKARAWAEAPYEKCTDHPETLNIKTAGGKLVRSKSEALIAMCLDSKGIPYRYECAMVLGSVTLYPDFTILHPQTGRLILWEHFGLMDQERYSRNAFQKLQLYAAYSYIPMVNLIITCETAEQPLDLGLVQALAENFFL